MEGNIGNENIRKREVRERKNIVVFKKKKDGKYDRHKKKVKCNT